MNKFIDSYKHTRTHTQSSLLMVVWTPLSIGFMFSRTFIFVFLFTFIFSCPSRCKYCLFPDILSVVMFFNSLIRRSICNKNKTLMSMLKTLCFHLLKLIVGVYLYNHGPFFISLISHYLTSTRTCETFHYYDWKFLFTRLSGKQIWGSRSSWSMFYSPFSPAPNTTTTTAAISHTHTHTKPQHLSFSSGAVMHEKQAPLKLINTFEYFLFIKKGPQLYAQFYDEEWNSA